MKTILIAILAAILGGQDATIEWSRETIGRPDGSVEIRISGKPTGKEAADVHGTLEWVTCSGNACHSPEEWEFEASIPASPEQEVSAGQEEIDARGTFPLILEAILWGLAMLLTPCVFPMVPMTVSFFLKRSGSRARGRFNAAMYGLFIILLYTVPITAIILATRIAGGAGVSADIFNWLSTHWIPNLLFFAVFMTFAVSFLGAFEITLPQKWSGSADRNSDRKGLAGVFFMALTLVLVSFSCTGPIVGTVLIKSTAGEFWTPIVSMLAFSAAFALPFTILAFFPSLLERLPKSGGWLNSVKVCLGFIEIALGLKFLSVADQTYHWGILGRDIYLAVWIVCFALMGLYLLGKLQLRHDTPPQQIGVTRLLLAMASFIFTIYLIPGLFGAPLKALSGYLPPMEQSATVTASTSISTSTSLLPHGLMGFDTIEGAAEVAKAEGKLVFVDITGHGCVNCREMEARVWSDPEVLRLLRENFVIAALYVDDKTPLPDGMHVRSENGRLLTDVGRVNSYIARSRFGVSSQPAYIIMDPAGNIINGPRGYDLSVSGFVNFLNSGI